MKIRTRKSLWIALLLLGALEGCTKRGLPEVTGFATDAPIELYNEDGVALGGYDPVAFFTENKPVKGLLPIKYDYQGAVFFFSSKENYKTFRADPERYLPQYGGFCAFGVANGYKAATDPTTFTIVNGKLYLTYNQEVQLQWNADRERLIKRADQNWPGVSFLTDVFK